MTGPFDRNRNGNGPPETPVRYPENAPGPFYVEKDLCISCLNPQYVAPDLIGYSDEHCYFKKQPETPEELERAISAVWHCCCGAYHYGGKDRGIIRRLLALRVARDQIDNV